MLIKDLLFSQELQESLSMAAQSKRIGESKIIAAKAEVRLFPLPPFPNIRPVPTNTSVNRSSLPS